MVMIGTLPGLGFGKEALVTVRQGFRFHWSDPVGTGSWFSVAWDNGRRASLPSDVPPGGKAVLVLSAQALPKPTREAKLIIAPVMDGPSSGWQQDAALVVTVQHRVIGRQVSIRPVAVSAS